MALALSAPVFAITSQLIEEATGLHYDTKDADLLAERLSRRAGELGFDSLLDYYYFLRYDAGGARELDVLVDLLVVNETYFFREVEQLRALVDRLLPRLLEERARARVWCAACSTGEEPFTLAMLLDEKGLLDRVDIQASDISNRVLAVAANAVYAGRSLRALLTPERRRHFLETGDGTVKVREPLRRHIRWRRANLMKLPPGDDLGRFDVILCRNVLIYFRDETVVPVVGSLVERLASGGYLLVGASESLLRYGTALGCEEHGGSFFYRKARP
jgi:chemotaxis protein methyltransferase CheR